MLHYYLLELISCGLASGVMCSNNQRHSNANDRLKIATSEARDVRALCCLACRGLTLSKDTFAKQEVGESGRACLATLLNLPFSRNAREKTPWYPWGLRLLGAMATWEEGQLNPGAPQNGYQYALLGNGP